MTVLDPAVTAEIERIRGASRTRAGMRKYRCVAAEYFSKENIRKKYINLLLEKGLSEDQARAFVESNRADILGEETDTESIGRNVKWCLSDESFEPQRYNTSEFGAYYTAKESETAKSERSFHYRKLRPTSNLSFTIFTVEVSADLADLRSSVVLAEAIRSESYATCQYVAQQLRSSCDALAAPSVRHPGGSCCAVFSEKAIVCGAVVGQGDFAP